MYRKKYRTVAYQPGYYIYSSNEQTTIILINYQSYMYIYLIDGLILTFKTLFLDESNNNWHGQRKPRWTEWLHRDHFSSQFEHTRTSSLYSGNCECFLFNHLHCWDHLKFIGCRRSCLCQAHSFSNERLICKPGHCRYDGNTRVHAICCYWSFRKRGLVSWRIYV